MAESKSLTINVNVNSEALRSSVTGLLVKYTEYLMEVWDAGFYDSMTMQNVDPSEVVDEFFKTIPAEDGIGEIL